MGEQQVLKELRDVVREARMDAGLSQVEVAQRVGRSQKWVSRIEVGDVVRPDINDMRKLADVLRIDLDDLVVATQMTRSRHHTKLLQAVPNPELPGEDQMRSELAEIVNRLDPRKLGFALTNLRMIEHAIWQDAQIGAEMLPMSHGR